MINFFTFKEELNFNNRMTSVLKNKYNNIYPDDFFNNVDREVNEMKEEYVVPSDYRISTMTMISCFTCNINLEVVSQFFNTDGKIVSMVYGAKPVKNLKKVSNRPFFNQATIIVKLDPLRQVNVKIFSNGKIQMTGIKKIEHGHEALKIIINKLKETKGTINLDKALESQLEKIYLENRKGEEHFKESYPINNSLFYKERLIKEIKKKIDCEEMEFHSIEKIDNFDYEEFQIVLINSDFNINFKIKRNILFKVLKDEYNIISRFEPGIYPGVNNKFFWNKLYKKDLNKKQGVCYCSKICNGKGKGNGDGECKKITIAAFSSGSVIITGAREKAQIDDCYNFINEVFKTHFLTIKMNPAPFLNEEKEQKRNTKKYVKPEDIIFINPNDFDNEYNVKILKDYNLFTSECNK